MKSDDLGQTAQLAQAFARDHYLVLLFLTSIVYGASLVFYRLFFHPLKHVPGPLLGRVTGWYEFYHDVILDGNFIKMYEGWHRRYGPVVRVSPNRVHINNPDYFMEVYVRKPNIYKKDPSFYSAGGGIKHSIIMLIDPKEHKVRKDTIKPLFAPRSVEDLAPVVLDVVYRAIERAKETYRNGHSLNIQLIYQAITVDTIMRIMFGTSLELVEEKDLVKPGAKDPPFLATMAMFADNFLITKHFPIIANVAQLLPMSIAQVLLPGYALFRQQCAMWIDEIAARNKMDVYTGMDGRTTIFDLLLNPNKEKGYKPLPREVLIDEAFALCFAGTDTTSYGMSCGTYYLLTNPDKLKLLLEELSQVQTNAAGMLEYKDIQHLPYLTAVVKEILRLSSPVSGIIPRIAPEEGAHVSGYFIPGGSIVSQTTRTIHFNSEVFPEPHSFIPERWLGSKGKDLEKYYVVFGKGPRSCMGMSISYLEMFLTIANFFNALDMTAHEQSMRWMDSAACRIAEHVHVSVNGIRKSKE